MPKLRFFAVVLAALALLLTGCGGGADEDDSANPSEPEPTYPSDIASPEIGDTIQPGEGDEDPPDYDLHKAKGTAVPDGFPIPEGAETSADKPFGGSWDFVVYGDSEDLIEFYTSLLPSLDYRLRLDVVLSRAWPEEQRPPGIPDDEVVETQHIDIVFDGPASGAIIAEPDGVSVTIYPKGQKALIEDYVQ